MSKNKNKPKKLGFRLILYNFIIQFSALFLISAFVLVCDIPSESYYITALIGLCTANFASGFINGKALKQKGLINGVIYSLPFNLLVIIVSLLLNELNFGYRCLLSLVALVVASAIGGVLSVNLKKKIKIKC